MIMSNVWFLYCKNRIYDKWKLWLMKFMKNVIYDFCDYGKRIIKNIFMTKVL